MANCLAFAARMRSFARLPAGSTCTQRRVLRGLDYLRRAGVEPGRLISPPAERIREILSTLSRAHGQFTVVLTGVEAMPLATTTSELAPASAPVGTSKKVETIVPPVATPMLLWP